MHRRYYGRDQQDKAGILRYTKVVNTILDISDVPAPANERELSWLLSFYWSLDQAYETLGEAAAHRGEGMRPVAYQINELQRKYRDGLQSGLAIDEAGRPAFSGLGLANGIAGGTSSRRRTLPGGGVNRSRPAEPSESDR